MYKKKISKRDTRPKDNAMLCRKKDRGKLVKNVKSQFFFVLYIKRTSEHENQFLLFTEKLYRSTSWGTK